MSKVIIQSREEWENVEMLGAHYHFNERLEERYGLSITVEDYLGLNNKPFRSLKVEKYKVTGLVEIDGIEVLAVRLRKKSKRFITALPLKNKVALGC